MLKFMVAAVTAYGMATLEGPLLAIKTVNSLSHYTDWTIAHVHTGALGWNGFLTFSVLYWLFPRLYNTKLWSTKLANYHFWIALLGMMFYVIPIYVAGITEGMMWKQFTKDGFLQYPNFLETVVQIVPMFRCAPIGGTLYIIGVLLMAYNLYRTAKAGQFVPEERGRRPSPDHAPQAAARRTGLHPSLARRPSRCSSRCWPLVAVLIGGMVEIIPMIVDQGERAHHLQRETLHAAGSAGPGHLHPRRLPGLPFADDPPVPLRNRALRRILQGGRIRL